MIEMGMEDSGKGVGIKKCAHGAKCSNTVHKQCMSLNLNNSSSNLCSINSNS